MSASHISGKCRVCGCTQVSPCVDEHGNACAWLDQGQTLCDNLDCLAKVPLSELEKMVPSR